jgi:RNA polymerase sigma-70 factor (ECF subfamily)
MFSTFKLSEGSVEDSMVMSEMQATIRSLVAALPDEQREVVEMRYYAKLSFQEIADETGVSINTALGRMRYALINLRKMIAEKQIVLSC